MVVMHKPGANEAKDTPVPIKEPKVYREFVAEVLILSHATTIKKKYQVCAHLTDALTLPAPKLHY